jgi:hypothetical protein
MVSLGYRSEQKTKIIPRPKPATRRRSDRRGVRRERLARSRHYGKIGRRRVRQRSVAEALRLLQQLAQDAQ